MEILIGSSNQCTYRINDEVVSRIHCRLAWMNNRLYLEDLGSTNGTYVNRARIAARSPVVIAPDTEILLAGRVPLDWGMIRHLLPPLSGGQSTTFVPPEEIDRQMQQRSVPRQPPAPAPPAGAYFPPQQPYQPQANPAAPERPIVVQQSAGTPRSDLLYAAHAGKSYVGAAFLSWIMYWVGFYIIGLILNFVYLGQASNTEKITGQSPPGKGCLQFLVFIHVILPLLLILLLVGGVVHLGNILPDFLDDLF
ncbi:MAG: FHA domain-containing protein [Acidobacteriota bacterium]|jgi:hypothetical protein|nr:FHA domain-containing protein [Acidobacteriota bacterium]